MYASYVCIIVKTTMIHTVILSWPEYVCMYVVATHLRICNLGNQLRVLLYVRIHTHEICKILKTSVSNNTQDLLGYIAPTYIYTPNNYILQAYIITHSI